MKNGKCCGTLHDFYIKVVYTINTTYLFSEVNITVVTVTLTHDNN